MTAVRGAGAPDVGCSGGAAPTAAAQVSDEVPRRADGIQLIGEMSGSGYRVPPSLVRRRDGQTIQLTGLLYAVLHAVDGHRDVGQVAEAASRATGRGISADNVRSLVDDKLRPMGLVTKADGSQPELKRSNPLLALRFRFAVTDPERTRRVTAPFAALFHPLVAVPMLVAFGLVCWWVFFEKGLASATYQAFDHPGLLILVFVVTVLSAGFHEFGHAAGARRGGATPGVMGAGVYLMWPAFYTDVTDSYRLGRGGRVRTDLGGLYFNAIVAVLVSGVWLVSGYDALLLVVATQILQMVRQLTPLVRFDGYHVLADLVGVPDLFHRIKPTLLGALPWRWGDPEARLLKPWARAVVTAWVAVVVPALLFMVFAMVVAMPRVLATAWGKLEREEAVLAGAWQHGHSTEVAARILAMAAVALPIGGTFLVITRMLRRLTRSVWRATQGRPGRRAAAGVAAAAVAAGLGFVWWPHPGTYRPIQPWDHGTVMDAVSAVPAVQAPRAGTFLEQGARGTMRTVWDTSSPLPTRAHPQLSLVLVPTDGSTPASPTVSSPADGRPQGWVFPFDEPLAPGPGDNQALAVNTTDGTVDYAVAFALVWVDDGAAALNRNEAYAYSSCRSCASVAVAFQVVLVVGNNHVAAPANLAGSLNYDCVNCLSYALAQQLFVTLDQPLSDGAMRRLDALWRTIAAFGDRIVAGQVSPSDIQPTLDGYQEQIKAIIGTGEPGASATPSATPSASASSAPTATSSPGSSASAVVPSGTTSTGSGPSPRPSSSSSSAPPSSGGPSATPSPSDADSGTSTATGTPSATASAE